MANAVRRCTAIDLLEAAMTSDRCRTKLNPPRIPAASRTEELPHLSEENLQNHNAASDDGSSTSDRVPSGPQSQASYGSTDSGLSHPPGHRKRKKVVGLSFSQLERGKRLDSDSASNDEPEESVCSSRPDCTSTSNPHKAVGAYFQSSIYIPNSVWLRCCTKHFLTRYSPLSKTDKIRINAVLKQLDKILEWNNADGRTSIYPFIRDWGFRLRGWESSTQYRLFEGPDQHGVSGTDPIPSWLIESQGKGMSHQYLHDILRRLQGDLESGTLKKLPYFILEPNIILDPNVLEPPQAVRSLIGREWRFHPPPMPPDWVFPGPRLAYSSNDRGWTVRGPDLAGPLISG